MAGSAVNLGISGGLFGNTPKLGAGMQSLMDNNAARGERIAESGRNAGMASVDLNDPVALRAAATAAQKAGDPVKSMEYFDRADKLTATNNAQTAAQTAQAKTAETERLTGLTAQNRAGMLDDPANANFPVILEQLRDELITPVQAQAAIDKKKAESVVLADKKLDKLDADRKDDALLTLAQSFAANGGDSEVADSMLEMTVVQAAKLLQEQKDLNPNSANNLQKEEVARQSEVDVLEASVRGMTDTAERELAQQTIKDNPQFWGTDPATGLPSRNIIDFSNSSSEYIHAFTAEVKEANIAKANGVKPIWKPSTAKSVDAAETLVDDMDSLLRPSNDSWGSYTGDTEWTSIIAQAIPSIQSGMDYTQVEAIAEVKKLITNGRANEGDNPYTMNDLQTNVRAIVQKQQMVRAGTAPTPTAKPPADAYLL